jgi:hypothetical protein
MAEDRMRSPAVPPQEMPAPLQQELAALRRQRSRTGWLMAGTAVVGVAILLGAAFGPLRDRIAADVTARLQRDLVAELRQPMQQEATATARQETARLLREDARNGALHGLLLAEARRLVAQGEPLRAAMADRAAVEFRAPQPELAKILASALAEAPGAGPVDAMGGAGCATRPSAPDRQSGSPFTAESAVITPRSSARPRIRPMAG